MKDWLRGMFGNKPEKASSVSSGVPSRATSDRVERLYEHHARTGLWTELAIRLDRLRRDGLQPGEEAIWYRIRAAADTEQGRLDSALTLLEEAREVYPDEVEIVSALADLHAARGEPVRMLAYDALVPFPAVRAAEALRQVRRAALWEAYREALTALEPVLQTTLELGTATASVLTAHGLPPLATTTRLGAALHLAVDESEAAQALVREAHSRVDDFDGRAILAELSVNLGGDNAALRVADERAAEDAERRARPAAEYLLRTAVLDARAAPDSEAAQACLDAVHITTLDPACLADLRELAREDDAYRRGDVARAVSLRRALLARPEHVTPPERAFRFLLTAAARRLAADYRATLHGPASAPTGSAPVAASSPTVMPSPVVSPPEVPPAEAPRVEEPAESLPSAQTRSEQVTSEKVASEPDPVEPELPDSMHAATGPVEAGVVAPEVGAPEVGAPAPAAATPVVVKEVVEHADKGLHVDGPDHGDVDPDGPTRAL